MHAGLAAKTLGWVMESAGGMQTLYMVDDAFCWPTHRPSHFVLMKLEQHVAHRSDHGGGHASLLDKGTPMCKARSART